MELWICCHGIASTCRSTWSLFGKVAGRIGPRGSCIKATCSSRHASPERLLSTASTSQLRGTDGIGKVSLVGYIDSIKACQLGLQWESSLAFFADTRKQYHEMDVTLRNSRTITQDLTRALNSTIATCTKRGQWHWGLLLLESVLEDSDWDDMPIVFTYNAVASACERARHWKGVLAILDDMSTRGVVYTEVTYSIATRAASRASFWEKALVFLLQDSQSQQVRLDAIAYNAGIDACSRGAHWRGSLILLLGMRAIRIEPNVASYIHAIGCCGASGQWELSIDLLRQAHTSTVQLGIAGPNAVLAACGASRQWSYSVALLHGMKSSNVKPDALSYGVAIGAMKAVGNWSAILMLLDEMEHQICSPDLVSINAAIGACAASASNWERCVALFSKMCSSAVTPNSITFHAVLDGFGKASRWDGALELLSKMKSANLELSLSMYRLAINACRHARQWQASLELVDAVMYLCLEPSLISYTTAISTCESGAQWIRGCFLLFEMQQRRIEPDVVAYGAAISACEKGARWEIALNVFWQMLAGNIQASVISYSAALSACAAGGRWVQALELLHDMELRCLHPNIICFNAAMHACKTGGRPRLGLEFLEEAISANLTPDVFSHSSAITAYGRNREWAKALSLIQGVLEARVHPDPYSLSAAIAACANSGQIDISAELLALMSESGTEANTIGFSAAIVGCHRGGFWAWALELLNRMHQRNLHPDIVSLNAAVTACAKARQCDVIKDLLLSVRSRAHEMLQERGADHDTALAVDLMRRFAVPDHTIERAFRDQVFQPVVSQFKELLRVEKFEQLTWKRLHDPCLEEQFGLGAHFTQQVLEELGFSRSLSISWKRATGTLLKAFEERRRRWLSASSCEEATSQTHARALFPNGNWPVEPVARILMVWVAYRLVATSSAGRTQVVRCDGRIVCQGRKPRVESVLLPVFAQHDRSNHSERQALLGVLDDLQDSLRETEIHLDERVPVAAPIATLKETLGEVWLMASHTPCISCLAALCQFKRILPNVDVHVTFTEWTDTHDLLSNSRYETANILESMQHNQT